MTSYPSGKQITQLSEVVLRLQKLGAKITKTKIEPYRTIVYYTTVTSTGKLTWWGETIDA